MEPRLKTHYDNHVRPKLFEELSPQINLEFSAPRRDARGSFSDFTAAEDVVLPRSSD
jgi:hypothetical protein